VLILTWARILQSAVHRFAVTQPQKNAGSALAVDVLTTPPKAAFPPQQPKKLKSYLSSGIMETVTCRTKNALRQSAACEIKMANAGNTASSVTDKPPAKQMTVDRREFLGRTLLLGLGYTTIPAFTGNAEPASRPNFIVILCDNLGYGDVACFGSKLHRTPNIDRMASEGMRFTDFYATSGVCTPSRASLMTGCYPRRVNMHVDEHGRAVLRPVARKGLNPDEITIAELLKTRAYATACIGKWHLGDQLPFLPTRQGFDYYLGIPYSDDMTPRSHRGPRRSKSPDQALHRQGR